MAIRNNDDEQYIWESTATRFSNTPEKCSRGVSDIFEHSPHLSFSVSAPVVFSLVDPDSSHVLARTRSLIHVLRGSRHGDTEKKCRPFSVLSSVFLRI